MDNGLPDEDPADSADDPEDVSDDDEDDPIEETPPEPQPKVPKRAAGQFTPDTDANSTLKYNLRGYNEVHNGQMYTWNAGITESLVVVNQVYEEIVTSWQNWIVLNSQLNKHYEELGIYNQRVAFVQAILSAVEAFYTSAIGQFMLTIWPGLAYHWKMNHWLWTDAWDNASLAAQAVINDMRYNAIDGMPGRRHQDVPTYTFAFNHDLSNHITSGASDFTQHVEVFTGDVLYWTPTGIVELAFPTNWVIGSDHSFEIGLRAKTPVSGDFTLFRFQIENSYNDMYYQDATDTYMAMMWDEETDYTITPSGLTTGSFSTKQYFKSSDVQKRLSHDTWYIIKWTYDHLEQRVKLVAIPDGGSEMVMYDQLINGSVNTSRTYDGIQLQIGCSYSDIWIQ